MERNLSGVVWNDWGHCSKLDFIIHKLIYLFVLFDRFWREKKRLKQVKCEYYVAQTVSCFLNVTWIPLTTISGMCFCSFKCLLYLSLSSAPCASSTSLTVKCHFLNCFVRFRLIIYPSSYKYMYVSCSRTDKIVHVELSGSHDFDTNT